MAHGGLVLPGGDRVLAVGRINNDFAVWRFELDYGTSGVEGIDLDTSFGDGGWVTKDIANYYDSAVDVVVQRRAGNTGKIVVSGTHTKPDYSSAEFALARFHPNGALDTSFAVEGVATIGFASLGYYQSHPLGVALQADDKIVVSGHATRSGGRGSDFVLARLHTDGVLDASFGEGSGHVIEDLSHVDGGSVVGIQPNGRIVVAGYTGMDNLGLDFATWRFNPDGSRDEDFGNGGWVVTDFGDRDTASSVALQPNGKIVVAGTSWVKPWSGPSYFALARYEAASAQEQIEILVAEVQNLVISGALNHGLGISLQLKLLGAIQQTDRDHARPAIVALEAFIDEVDAMVDSGMLPAEDGYLLIAGAEAAIAALEG